MTRLNKFPGNRYRQPKPEVEIFPDFDETLTPGLDDTVRGLHTLRQSSGSEYEAGQLELQLLNGLLADAKVLAANQQKIISTLKTKASKGELALDAEQIQDHLDKRVDVIRNVAMWAIGIEFALIGLILVKVWK